MEAGIFALVAFFWIYLADRWGWFAPTPPPATATCVNTELALGALLGVSCWLRPEGVVLAALALAFRAVCAPRLGIRWRSAVFRSVLFMVPFGVVVGALVALHVSQTGYVLPGSALSRCSSAPSRSTPMSWRVSRPTSP
jgi:hypothetical protein